MECIEEANEHLGNDIKSCFLTFNSASFTQRKIHMLYVTVLCTIVLKMLKE